MKSIVHPLFYCSRSIPEEVRPDVITAIDRNMGVIAWNRQDLEYIFQVYNRYVAPKGEPEDIGCGGCRTKVIGKMREFYRIWKENT